ncbi:unnamed protein product [Strongylus vulgaris]|uniref:Uncharacterized protein n=1 Tax=Strongylus vulgaris TaxID=40348 RepID=A0A3P7LSE7_STRVU|nr:unnamed protein product [Strongylus vulgaris]
MNTIRRSSRIIRTCGAISDFFDGNYVRLGIVKVLESAAFPLDNYSNDFIKGLGGKYSVVASFLQAKWLDLALLNSSSEELRDAAIDGIVAITSSAEASTVEKIVNYLLEQLSGLFVFNSF